jgi:hypothetical protein
MALHLFSASRGDGLHSATWNALLLLRPRLCRDHRELLGGLLLDHPPIMRSP